MGEGARLPLEYVLPLRWYSDEGLAELDGYLRQLSHWADVTVVDGSPVTIFRQHAETFGDVVRHLASEPWPGRTGKVAGVVTGIRHARHELVVVADDDVRYDRSGLQRVGELLVDADLVRPQNYFDPRPWHARWDTARTLLNRAFGSDYPGTFGLRRSTFLSMGGYDGNVLFENLELCRTVRAVGGREHRAPSLFVRRRPPSTRHFLRQRVRQAYDDLAQPARLLVEASVVPVVVTLLRRAVADSPRGSASARQALAALAIALVAAAEVGRRRADGTTVFGPSAPLWAPAWVLERGVCVWVALAYRITGGMPYAGQRLAVAAHSVHWLRRHRAPTLSERAQPPHRGR